MILLIGLLLASAAYGSDGSSGGAPDAQPVEFDRDVLPILSDHCFHCHGPDAATRKADLRLDVQDDVLFVAEPGEPGESELFARIKDAPPRQIMPPPEFEKPLSEEQVEVLRRWIAEGVAWESHWAFDRPMVPAVPESRPGSELASESEGEPEAIWALDPLDHFVAALHEENRLRPAAPASPGTWLRRVTFDITGLPPTLDELGAFEAAWAAAPDAAAKQAARTAVVDRLLEGRPRAEHRTREWLDVARYADSNGYQNDFGRDQWPWRDWVLRAYESNMPYHQFVTEQIAGDLIPNPSTESITATGFQRNHRTVTEAGSLDEEWRVENVADRAETTATAFLGLTLACARCHDHKYDALTQADYYRFYGFFNSIDEKGVYQEVRGNTAPMIHLYSEGQLERLEEIRAEKKEWAGAMKRAMLGAQPRFAAWREAPPLEALKEAPAPRLERLGELDLAGGTGPSGSIDLGTDVDFAREEPFTASFWLRPFSHGAVYSRMNDDDTYRGVDLVLLDSMLPAVHLIHDWPERAIKVVGEVPLERARWHHVAVTYDGTSKASGVTLHINGQRQSVTVETDTLDGPISSEAPLLLGQRRYAGRLDGRMADLRFDRGVLPDEVLLSLAAKRAAGEDGLPYFQAAFDEEINEARVRIIELQAEEKRLSTRDVPTVMVLADLPEPRPTHLLDRGRYDRPIGDPLLPDIPEVFGGLPDGYPRNRLALASWIASPGNPLTARVAVNRIWASFFGVGLTATQDDFGVRGERPVSQELLDYLATEFIRSGWNVKALERRIALSATYAQSSQASDASRAIDPDGRLLSRGPRHRLDAEMVRDQALLVSGLLKPRFGGKPVHPYQPEGLWKELAGGAGQGAYVHSIGDDLFRRSLYTVRKRTVPHPMLTTFDAPSFELCIVRRGRTNTPLQALATLNDTIFLEASRHLARRMMDAGPKVAEQLNLGARAVLARDLAPGELSVLTSGLERYSAEFAASTADAVELLGVGDTAPPMSERTPDWAAMTMVASTLLNLDEALTRP